MKVALIQSPLAWENAVENRKYFAQKIESITETVDLILLPEMFTTGFSMQPKAIAETMQGETVSWMKDMAKSTNAAVCGSIVITEDGEYFNRLLFIDQSGKIESYDKRHLFTLTGEEKVYKAGKERLLINYKGFKICALICYDLRFPAFSRNNEDYDLLIFVANWPKPRINAWDILLKARAVENMCFAIGVNRIGTDGNELEYNGHSQVIDCLGNHIITPRESEGIFIAALDKNTMLEMRAKLPFLKDQDRFTLD